MEQAEDLIDANLELLSDDKQEELEAGGQEGNAVDSISSRRKKTKKHPKKPREEVKEVETDVKSFRAFVCLFVCMYVCMFVCLFLAAASWYWRS